MKISNLMIGDWVAYFGDIESKYPVKIEGMDIATGALITSDREDVGFDGISPIPLTSEILEKNGFKKFVAGSYIIPSKGEENFTCITPMEKMPNANGKWLVAIKNGYTDVKIPITYIHELQHALRICGIEKEIEL